MSATLMTAALAAANLLATPHVEDPTGFWTASDGVVASITYFRSRENHLEGDDRMRLLLVNTNPEETEGALLCVYFAGGDLGFRFSEGELRWTLEPGETREIEIRSDALLSATSMACSLIMDGIRSHLTGHSRTEAPSRR